MEFRSASDFRLRTTSLRFVGRARVRHHGLMRGRASRTNFGKERDAMSKWTWMLSAILALGLWPAVAHGQTSARSGSSGEKRYTADELKSRAYDQLMRKALSARVSVLKGEPYGVKKGEVNPYRRTKREKVLAICVDWIASTPDFFVGRTWSVQVGSNRYTRRTAAMFYCKKYQHARRQSCTCAFVDENDRNVLQLPKEFLARYAKP